MKQSAGILVYRLKDRHPEVLLVHPGGPYFQNKDEGAWSIPKGELDENEEPLNAAVREFEEELGTKCPADNFLQLSSVKQKSGKIVHAWACEGDLDVSEIKSNMVSIQWPPKSGLFIDVPEVDRAAWFDAVIAKQKINPAQVALIDELERLLPK